MAAEIKVGSYTGDGAAQTFNLGFVPDYIRIVNATDGDIAWEWFEGMTDGHALQSISVVDNATSGAAGMSRITSNGVTGYDGTLAATKGFTIGTALSESGKTFRYVAMRNADY